MTSAEALRRLEEKIAGTKHVPYFLEMRARYRFVLDALGRFRDGGRVMDVGCAPGHLSWMCREMGYEVTGVDLYPEKDFVGGTREGETLSLLESEKMDVRRTDLSAGALPFEDGVFDAALFNETIEHLPGRPHGVMEEIRRVLRPGGRLFLTTPNVAGVRNRLRLLLGKNIYTDLEVLRTVEAHKLHHREYTLSELRELAERCGFRAVRAASLHFGKERAADSVFRVLTTVAPGLRSNLYLEAERPPEGAR